MNTFNKNNNNLKINKSIRFIVVKYQLFGSIKCID